MENTIEKQIIEKPEHVKKNAKSRTIRLGKQRTNTSVEKGRLQYLYYLACESTELKDLCAVRIHEETKKLSENYYKKFIRLVDRLMETL